MTITLTSSRLPAMAGAAIALFLAGCEAPPPAAEQNHFRGVAMEQVYNPRTEAALRAANVPPEADPPADDSGPPIRELTDVYKNVKVLGDLKEGQFLRLMSAMSNWVAPKEGDEAGCAYCHNLENMADDSKYQYTVARRMLQMTKTINEKWANHVGATGVTCYTCHRGQPVPAHTWVEPGEPSHMAHAGWRPLGQNVANRGVNSSSLPADYFALLRDPSGIRVVGRETLRPEQPGAPIISTDTTYALMIHMSNALGVNCTFCHNSRNFGSWSTSTPQRVTAFHGLRMVPDINATYVEPLGVLYPRERRGAALDDAAKVYCTTCHQGVNKPLYGAQMLKDYLIELKAADPAWQPTLPAKTAKTSAAGTAPPAN